jgi:hypothetical protein
MADFWFLDLDGVRSGPYQTNEIMSLIAEGEVLPHHRISAGLKDKPWKSILEWRLEQARSPSSSVRPPEPPPSIAPPKAQEAVIEVMPDLLLPERTLSEPSIETGKGDPMAEMFDVLQHNKTKREARQTQIAQHLATESAIQKPESKSSIWKLLLICVFVAIIGLALGQWFKQNVEPPAKSEKTAKPVENAKTPEPATEVIDRSNGKMTIRAVVDKKPEPTPMKPAKGPSRPAIPTQGTKEPEYTPPVEKKAPDRELEELKDLKKELQELKSLKEQLKEVPLNDDFSDNDLGAPPPAPGEYPNYGGYGPGVTPSPAGRPNPNPEAGDLRY